MPVITVTGNADLRQDYTHRIFARFSKTNTDKASVFYVLLSAQYTQHYIGNSTFTADRDLLIRGLAHPVATNALSLFDAQSDATGPPDTAYFDPRSEMMFSSTSMNPG